MNGDGLDDVFIGGSPGAPARLFVQRRDGSFVESSQPYPWTNQRYEDWGAQFFDANGDGRLDLYVASGGYQLAPVSALLQDRLYINQGNGRFVRDSAALPPMLTSTAAIAVGDFNGDGRPDLFVGGRVTPRNYPYPARSYLLRNDGGHFTDVTDSLCPELARPFGMITAAVWVTLLASASEVRVIHGRSGGRVKQAVHARLRELSVRSVRLDPRNPGVTIVTF